MIHTVGTDPALSPTGNTFGGMKMTFEQGAESVGFRFVRAEGDTVGCWLWIAGREIYAHDTAQEVCAFHEVDLSNPPSPSERLQALSTALEEGKWGQALEYADLMDLETQVQAVNEAPREALLYARDLDSDVRATVALRHPVWAMEFAWDHLDAHTKGTIYREINLK